MGAVEILSGKAVEQMRASCKLAAATLVHVDENLRVGMTTEDINTLVHQFITSHDAYPSPLNYRGFPKSVCTSVNDVVCHGIPDKAVTLVDGDIVNVDVTTYLPSKKGFHGDTSVTFYVGKPSKEAKLVTETARACLEVGIAQVKHGARIGDIGAAIQALAESRGCSVVRDYVGHGIGREFHSAPQIPHYGTAGTGRRMKTGMIFTIEPMVNLGGYECVLESDDWTVRTQDRTLSAQFEHTLIVTREGAEVLTSRDQPLKHSETFDWTELGPRSTAAAYQARKA